MDYIQAHSKSINNKLEIEKSKKCGCFHCLQIFEPSEIKIWIKDISDTALCPYCNIDAVIPETNEIIIESKLLEEMNRHWFGPIK